MDGQHNNTEFEIRHLEMIEAVIERMAQNSFRLKGWAVTLVSVISALVINGVDCKLGRNYKGICGSGSGKTREGLATGVFSNTIKK